MAAAVSPTMLAVLTIGVGALILGIMIGKFKFCLTKSLNPKVDLWHRTQQLVWSAILETAS